jgi:hypothetical protein
MTAAASEDNNSRFNTAFAAAIDIAAATAIAAAVTIAFSAAIVSVLALSVAITVVSRHRHRHCRRHQCCHHHALTFASALTIAAAYANVTAPPMLLLMVGCCVVCHSLPAALSVVHICQPPHCAVVKVDNDRYCRRQQLPSPLPQLTMTTSKSQRLLFVLDGSNEGHCQLQRRLMATTAVTSLPPPSTPTTGWWPTARCCRRHQCCHHHTLALVSTDTITAAFANVITPPTLLLMVGCCVVCRPLPAASSAVQICQPPSSCSASLTLS